MKNKKLLFYLLLALSTTGIYQLKASDDINTNDATSDVHSLDDNTQDVYDVITQGLGGESCPQAAKYSEKQVEVCLDKALPKKLSSKIEDTTALQNGDFSALKTASEEYKATIVHKEHPKRTIHKKHIDYVENFKNCLHGAEFKHYTHKKHEAEKYPTVEKAAKKSAEKAEKIEPEPKKAQKTIEE